jgi:hypothetical protein
MVTTFPCKLGQQGHGRNILIDEYIFLVLPKEGKKGQKRVQNKKRSERI